MPTNEFTTALTFIIPMRDVDGEVIGKAIISNDDNEMQVFSSFGIDGTYCEACIHVIDPITTKKSIPQIGDPISVVVHGIKNGTLIFIISNVRYKDTLGDENWRLEITGEAPLYYWMRHCEYNGTIDLGKSKDYGEAISKLMRAAMDANGLPDKFTVHYNKDKVSKAFDYIFSFNQTVAFIINRIAHELELEYYYSPFGNDLYIGSPSPSDEELDTEGLGRLAGAGRHVKYAIPGGGGDAKVVYDAVIPGALYALPGSLAAMADGWLWKVVKGSYYARGDGERENHVKLLRADVLCDDLLLAVLEDEDIHSSFPEVGDLIKVGDVSQRDGMSDKDHVHGRYQALVAPSDSSKQDSGAWDFSDEIKMLPLTKTTPFAGDGVGLLFPKTTKSRALIFSPNEHHNHGYIGPMTWKEGKDKQQVPEKEDDDFLLRLEDGYIYFDKANATWLLRSATVKIEAATPAAATTKPDTTPESGTYIKIENDGSVTVKGTIINVEGTHINLGENAAKMVALADHTHSLASVFCSQLYVPGAFGGVMGGSNSNTSKTKAE